MSEDMFYNICGLFFLRRNHTMQNLCSDFVSCCIFNNSICLCLWDLLSKILYWFQIWLVHALYEFLERNRDPMNENPQLLLNYIKILTISLCLLFTLGQHICRGDKCVTSSHPKSVLLAVVGKMQVYQCECWSYF